jgi:hypothetical protein
VVFTFGEEVLSRSPFLIRHILPHNHLNPPSVVTSFLVGNAFFALLLGVPAAIVTWITNFFLPGHATSFILGAAFVLWGMNFVFTTIKLPFNIRSGWKTRANTRSLLQAMVTAYLELAPGVVSTVRLREVVAAAADKGVVWPNPLFALLDDNIKRSSGRL